MIQHIINGQKVDSKESFETINPATGEVIDTVASGGQEEVNAAVAAISGVITDPHGAVIAGVQVTATAAAEALSAAPPLMLIALMKAS